MDIIAFAFKKNVSSKVLEKLSVKKKYFIESSNEAIAELANNLIKESPNYILGLGMYNRSDKEKLRIETHYTKNKRKFPINYFLKPSKDTKYANGIGNSYCNQVSLLIMEAIRNNKLNSKYTFIHIPKTFHVKKVVIEIEETLSKIA